MDWWKRAVENINSMPYNIDNWDSYGGSKTDPVAAYNLLVYLKSILPSNCPAPFIVPGNQGEVEATWHRKNYTVSIGSYPDGRITYWVNHEDLTIKDPYMKDEELVDGMAHVRLRALISYMANNIKVTKDLFVSLIF